jgi:hypothetical protein
MSVNDSDTTLATVFVVVLLLVFFDSIFPHAPPRLTVLSRFPTLATHFPFIRGSFHLSRVRGRSDVRESAKIEESERIGVLG